MNKKFVTTKWRRYKVDWYLVWKNKPFKTYTTIIKNHLYFEHTKVCRALFEFSVLYEIVCLLLNQFYFAQPILNDFGVSECSDRIRPFLNTDPGPTQIPGSATLIPTKAWDEARILNLSKVYRLIFVFWGLESNYSIKWI